jgi:hypothetical protein
LQDFLLIFTVILRAQPEESFLDPSLMLRMTGRHGAQAVPYFFLYEQAKMRYTGKQVFGKEGYL